MTGAVAVLASYGAELPATLVLNFDPSAQGAMPSASITTSASFNGSTQRLSTTGGTGTAMGTGNFTWECWVRATASTDFGTFIDTIGADTGYSAELTDGAYFGLDSGTLYPIYIAGSNTLITSSIAVTVNTWTHVAVVRNSGTTTLYVGGVSGGTYAESFDLSAPWVTIGGSAGVDGLAGQISNLRMVKGTAVYTGTFTPPTVTLRAIAGTQLLLPLTATPFMDVSTNLFAITNTATVVTTAQAPSITAATTDVTGTYSLTTVNAGATPIAWSSNNGGLFRKTSTTSTDRISLGIDYSLASQGYTVFLAYKLTPASASSGNGRILSANTDSPDWLLGSYAPGTPSSPVYSNSWYANAAATNYNSAGSGGVFAGGTGAWNFVWATFNGTTKVAKKYVASATVNNTAGPPSAVLTTTLDSGQHGFNGLRLWNRNNTFEAAMGDIGVIRVYDGAATLTQVQELWTAYHTRFGI
jgi:Concanavalin A-like lectin/glucanases superfamily